MNSNELYQFYVTLSSFSKIFRWAWLTKLSILGGLGLPNFLSYYWAANAHKLLLWFTSPQSSWCQLESDSCISSSPQALACGTLLLPYSQYTSNPILVASLKVWAQIRGHFKWSFLPQSTPICRNHLFVPARIDPRFMFLARKGLHSLKDLYVEGSFASFNQLRAIFGLASSDFFRYFQLHDFARTHSPAFPLIPTTTGMDHVLLANTTTKGHVSYLYDLLLPANELTIEKM